MAHSRFMNNLPPSYGPSTGPYAPPPGAHPYGQAPRGPWHPSGTTSDERTWAILGHVGALILYFFAPLISLLVKGNESAFVRRHSTESLNFQLTWFIVLTASAILMIPLTLLTFGLAFVPFFLLLLAYVIFDFVVIILAAIKAGNGEDYRYPLSIRMIR